jgi:apolipoprotein N-acyltransferase
LRIWWCLTASVSSGLLLALAFPPYNLTWLGWVGAVPLLISLRRVKPWQAFLAGWMAGIVYFVVVFPWINEVGSAGKLAISCGHLYLGLYLGLFCLLARLIHKRFNPPHIIAAPVWVACDYLRSHFFFLAFPWALLGHTQYLQLPIVQIATVTGAYGVTFLMVLAGGAIADLIEHWLDQKKTGAKFLTVFNHKRVYVAFLIFSMIAISWGLGWQSLSKELEGSTLHVAVVQGNIPQDIKWDPKYREKILSTYERLSFEAAELRPQLIVWPEAATPGFVLKNFGLLKRMITLIKRLNTSFIIGSSEYPKFNKDPQSTQKSANSALFFSREGKRHGQYIKNRLVPLGEYLPYESTISWPDFIIPPGKKYYEIQGTESEPFQFNGLKLGMLICWENIFPELTRNLIQKEADLIINISNEAWFGKTGAPFQILSMCVFRAVENRINMIRATNTGVSCFIDPFGRITGRVSRAGQELFVEGVSSSVIRLSSPGTFYSRYGDIFAWGCIAFTLVCMLWWIFTRTPESASHKTGTKGEKACKAT